MKKDMNIQCQACYEVVEEEDMGKHIPHMQLAAFIEVKRAAEVQRGYYHELLQDLHSKKSLADE
jgi:hypothetical protein